MPVMHAPRMIKSNTRHWKKEEDIQEQTQTVEHLVRCSKPENPLRLEYQ